MSEQTGQLDQSFFDRKTTIDRNIGEIDWELQKMIRDFSERHSQEEVRDIAADFEDGIIEYLDRGQDRKMLNLGSGLSLAGHAQVVNVDNNPRDASTIYGDANESLNFPDQQFDVCLASYLIPWLNDPVATLNEMIRITKKGGYVIFNGLDQIRDETGTLLFANLEDETRVDDNVVIVFVPGRDFCIIRVLDPEWRIKYELDRSRSVTPETTDGDGKCETPWGERYIADYAKFVYKKSRLRLTRHIRLGGR